METTRENSLWASFSVLVTVAESESPMKSHHSADIRIETFQSVCGCNFVSLQPWFVR